MRQTPLARVAGLPPVCGVSSAIFGSDARLHRTLTAPCFTGRPFGVASCTSARSLFGGWRAATAAQPVEAAPHPQQTTTAPPPPPSLTRPSAAANAEVLRLRQQVVDLKEALEASQETVKQLLILTSTQRTLPCSEAAPAAAAAAAAAAAKKTRGACYVVRTSEELVDALRGRGSEHASRTILLDGKVFFLGVYGRVEVDQARVSIVGNNATIIGHLSVRGRGAVLAASDVFFLCPYDLELRQGGGGATKLSTNPTGKKPKENVAHLNPVIGATAGAGVHLDRCVLSNGRDGVYLGMGSHCTLRHVRIVNCIRGLYEGVGCRTSMVDTCAFQANRYDMVLLGPGGSERANRLFKQASAPSTPVSNAAAFTASFSPEASAADVLGPGLATAGDVALQQNKAHVVLQHSPITDIYEDCWADGHRVELTGADATAGLSDPLF